MKFFKKKTENYHSEGHQTQHIPTRHSEGRQPRGIHGRKIPAQN